MRNTTAQQRALDSNSTSARVRQQSAARRRAREREEKKARGGALALASVCVLPFGSVNPPKTDFTHGSIDVAGLRSRFGSSCGDGSDLRWVKWIDAVNRGRDRARIDYDAKARACAPIISPLGWDRELWTHPTRTRPGAKQGLVDRNRPKIVGSIVKRRPLAPFSCAGRLTSPRPVCASNKRTDIHGVSAHWLVVSMHLGGTIGRSITQTPIGRKAAISLCIRPTSFPQHTARRAPWNGVAFGWIV